MIKPRMFKRVFMFAIFVTVLAFSRCKIYAQDYCEDSPDPDCWCDEYGDCDPGGGDCDPDYERCGGGSGGDCEGAPVVYLDLSYDQTTDNEGNVYAWLTASNDDGTAGEALITASVSMITPDGTVVPTVVAETSTEVSVTATAIGSFANGIDNGGGSITYVGSLETVSGCESVYNPFPPITIGLARTSEQWTGQVIGGPNVSACYYSQSCLNPPPKCAPTYINVQPSSIPCDPYLVLTSLVINGSCSPIAIAEPVGGVTFCTQ